ncbi:DUF2510 domain-containing protein [Rhodococcus sp. NPDC056516]|uniref:DUF2510 domain-containing protein n=1 Tax=Rhodococcus sp. NPDC056516 TaxID=3345847 RepID=UPI00366BF669
MNPPAGWNPDPFDPTIDRYWDGQQWTAQTRPKGVDAPTQAFGTPTQVFGAPESAAPDANAEEGSKRRKWPWIAGAAVVGLVAIAAATGAGKSEEATTPAATSSTTAAATTTKSTVPSTTKTTTSSVPPTTTTATTLPTTTTTVAIVPLVPQVPETTTTPYVPPAPAYTPPKTTEPAYVPPKPSGGTVNPGSFCSTPGATGVTKKGTPMVCGIGSDGRDRWVSAG